MTSPALACIFCGADASPAVLMPRFGTAACHECAGRIGRLVQASAGAGALGTVSELWPLLTLPDEDDLEPEPRVRKSDGTVVELREVTAEMKRDLPLEKRMQLAETYGSLGMLREQIQECGFILGNAKDHDLLQRAFDVLFSRTLYRPKDLEHLRGRLFPA